MTSQTWILIAFILPISYTWAQLNCAEAPSPSLKIICEQLTRWDKNARASPAAKSPTSKVALPPGIDPSMATQGFDLPTQPTTLEQCTDLGCVCSFLGGSGSGSSCTLRNGQPLRKALRKEYRTLTDDERRRYHAAVRTIKNNGAYDRISKVHSDFATSGAAHSGPAFLSWHREFIKRYELALRAVDPSVALPYWDSVLDNNLPRPQDSILWTNDFAGTTDGSGNVVGGAFAPWRTMDNRPNSRRAVGAQGSLFRETEIAYVMAQTQVENVMAYSAPRQGCPIRADWNWLEYTHGNVHIYVGGDMLDQSTSSNDPIFFMHHSFVDLIWEMWRQSRQTRAQRESDYPVDMQACSAPQHFNGASMAPFTPWYNRDGLSNRYTDFMYEYAPRPTCPSCGGSKYLFCMRSGGQPRCAAKVKVGGSCSGLNEADQPCFNGACRAGTCVQTVVTTPTPATTQSPVITPIVPPQSDETCYNENECCSTWQGQGECGKNPGYMNSWCKASCGQCRPKYSLGVECSDRHPNCITWSRQGECSKNKNWMFENCRKSCARCSTTRASACGGGGRAQPAAKPAPTGWASKCTSPGCFNENICCSIWAMDGQCRTNATWMACNCKVSCGGCIPQAYVYGTCTDYEPKCPGWARAGECNKNPWMKENCRASCQTCLNGQELRSICRSGGAIPTRTSAQFNQGWGRPPPQNPQMGGWGFDGIDVGPFAFRWGRDVHHVSGAPGDHLAE